MNGSVAITATDHGWVWLMVTPLKGFDGASVRFRHPAPIKQQCLIILFSIFVPLGAEEKRLSTIATTTSQEGQKVNLLISPCSLKKALKTSCSILAR